LTTIIVPLESAYGSGLDDDVASTGSIVEDYEKFLACASIRKGKFEKEKK